MYSNVLTVYIVSGVNKTFLLITGTIFMLEFFFPVCLVYSEGEWEPGGSRKVKRWCLR